MALAVRSGKRPSPAKPEHPGALLPVVEGGSACHKPGLAPSHALVGGEPRHPLHLTREEHIMGRHPASKIGAWRTSGVNRPGYSRPPQQAPRAPQQALSGDMRIDLANLGPDASAHLAAAEEAGVTLVPPFKVDPATPCATVRAGKFKVRVPMGWQISTSKSGLGGWVVFVLEANQTLHVLAEREGRLWEMSHLPQWMSDDFITKEFKDNPR